MYTHTQAQGNQLTYPKPYQLLFMNLSKCHTEREKAGEVAGSLTCGTLELGEDGLRLAVSLSALLQEKAADMRGPPTLPLLKSSIPCPHSTLGANSKGD